VPAGSKLSTPWNSRTYCTPTGFFSFLHCVTTATSRSGNAHTPCSSRTTHRISARSRCSHETSGSLDLVVDASVSGRLRGLQLAPQCLHERDDLRFEREPLAVARLAIGAPQRP
jgi:hypothetical protein